MGFIILMAIVCCCYRRFKNGGNQNMMMGQIQNIDMTSTKPIQVTPSYQTNTYGYPVQPPQYFYQPQPQPQPVIMDYQTPYQMNPYQPSGVNMWGQQQPIGGPIYR